MTRLRTPPSPRFYPDCLQSAFRVARRQPPPPRLEPGCHSHADSHSEPIATPQPDTPLGTQENPIVLALIPSSGREIPESAQDLAAQLSHLTGLVIVPFAPASYTEVLDALGEGRVHIAWLPPFPYLLAHKQGYADAALATTRLWAAT